MAGLDWARLGFRCGLEIHQQLATTKLFCSCRTDAAPLDDEHPDFLLERQLRPTQSELGEVDAAALAEARRNQRFTYLGFHGHACLVEVDEEPPHPPSEPALDVALTMALLFQSRTVDEVEWMRKIVIDGSNTSGFQRTALVALGGSVDGVGIQTIALEEDSARRVREEPGRVVYGLDRLGIPLIEIATEPTLRDGQHAKQAAARIGALLRSTGRVKRGLGTIRQDLNVSIAGGSRIEIKGVQDLASIPRVTEYEVRRQAKLLEIRQRLQERRVGESALTGPVVDATSALARSESKLVQKSIKDGDIVLGLRLPGFHGLLGSATKEEPRLGRELADYAKRLAGVQGLLHGDELPGLGIAAGEVEAVRNRLQCGPQDSFALVVAQRARAEAALAAVRERAVLAVRGVPPEVRAAEADGSTTYLRPMPGAARMYPETDVPPQRIPPERLERLRRSLPLPPEAVAAGLRSKFSISEEEANQLVAEGLVQDLELLARDSNGSLAGLASRTLLSVLPEIEKRFPGILQLDPHVTTVLRQVRDGKIAKEGVPLVLEKIAEGQKFGQSVAIDDAVKRAGLGSVDERIVEERARTLVAERGDFVRQRGLESVGPLMGVLMKEFRGKVDGQVLSETLGREVERYLSQTTAAKK